MNDAMPQGDVNPRSFTGDILPFVRQPSEIRRATEIDRPFVMELVKEKYPDRYAQGIPYVNWCLNNPDRLVAVGPHSFGVASAMWHYGFQRRGGISILCCRPVAGASFEIVRMVRFMLDWAKAVGCEGDFTLVEDTGVDFGPLVRRLGGVSRTVWRIPLGEKQ